MAPPPPPEEIAQLMRFIAEKTKNVKSPMNVSGLAAEFKEKSGSPMVLRGLRSRIEKNRQKIHRMDEFDMDTKVNMIFALGASIDKGFLNELKNQAEVEVDEKRRITKYKKIDGSLELGGHHGQKYIQRSLFSSRWQKVCEKANYNKSEAESDEDSNGQKDRENKRVDLVRFLIARTKNVTSPWSLDQLSTDYKEESKCLMSLRGIRHQITFFRKRIHEMNQFDMPTKARMMFALSATVDPDFLKELQKNAIVELDEHLKIKKYKANDESLELKGDHSRSAKIKAGLANKKKKKMSVVNDLSDSEEGEEEKDSSETNRSEEEGDEGNVRGSVKLNQLSTSLPKRRSTKIGKSTVSTKNNNKKRTTITQNQPEKKRTRISYSSSETSKDDEDSMTLEDDLLMDSETTTNVDHGGDDFDYDPPANNHYDEDLEHNATDPNSERNVATPEVMDDKKEEAGPSSSAEIESMSLLQLLNYLRSPIAQYTPNLVSKIVENIEQLEEKDKQIPFYIILGSLESCVQILNTPDEMDSDEDTTSLPNFFYRLGIAMCNITNPLMDDFYLKIKKLACTAEKKVSIEHIRYAMGKTLDKILH